MTHRGINRTVAAAIFVAAELLYLATMAPTLSFWDCGEFIATAYTLGIPHPPGAPLFLLLGRLFSMIPLPLDTGAKVNLISTGMSAATVMLAYLITVRLIVICRKSDADSWSLAEKISGYGGAVVGSLALAVSDSFWFNAVETEVYAASSFLTAAVIWMMLCWYDEEELPGSGRWILGVMYLFGLSIGVHLLCLLAIFAIAMVYYFRKYEFNVRTFSVMVLLSGLLFILIYKGVIIGLPELMKAASWWGVILLLGLLAGGAWYAHRKRLVLANMACMSLLLIIIGYTSYALIYVRAQADPPINENNPSSAETFFGYINRDQYGEMPLWPRRWSPEPVHQYFYERYESDFDYFVSYQLNHMYLRYFGWQFIGRQSDMEGSPVDWSKLWGLPLMVGAVGAYSHFRRHRSMALVVTALFLLTGAALVVYLNQTEPQPRERDYSYVGSFFAFALWIGIGIESLFMMLSAKLKPGDDRRRALLAAGIVGVGLLLVDGRMLQANYRSHDRSGNYVAWDWAWNMLQSCEKDAILFTNGDNDTFPLWYLQEVERVRTDVRVVNLSLANTGWYLLQLKHGSPRGAKPIDFGRDDRSLADITYEPVDSLDVAVPSGNEKQRLIDLARKSGGQPTAEPADFLSWRVLPALTYDGQGFLRPQDIAALEIVMNNFGRRPIYFGLTVGEEGMIGLGRHLRLDGLVYRVVPHTSDSPMSYVDPGTLYRNLFDTYRFRNVNNPRVFIDDTSRSMLGNYPPLFLRLAMEFSGSPAGFVSVPAGRGGAFVRKTGAELALEALDRSASLFPMDRYFLNPRLAGSAAAIYAAGGAKQKAYPYIEYLESLAAASDMSSDPALFYILAKAYRGVGMDRKADMLVDSLRQEVPELQRQLDSLKQ